MTQHDHILFAVGWFSGTVGAILSAVLIYWRSR